MASSAGAGPVVDGGGGFSLATESLLAESYLTGHQGQCRPAAHGPPDEGAVVRARQEPLAGAGPGDLRVDDRDVGGRPPDPRAARQGGPRPPRPPEAGGERGRRP